MKSGFVAAILAALVLSAGSAKALTLSNNDDITYAVDVIVGEGAAGQENYSLAEGQSLESICPDGCTIRLDNGVEGEFSGTESVAIIDGEFVISE